jgi:hypothetical protein
MRRVTGVTPNRLRLLGQLACPQCARELSAIKVRNRFVGITSSNDRREHSDISLFALSRFSNLVEPKAPGEE